MHAALSRRRLLQSLTASAALWCAEGCRLAPSGPLVGFSQMDSGGAWRVAETESMRRAAAEQADRYELVVTDAQDQTAKQVADVEDAISAYKAFDQRQPGWLKVDLAPAAA